MRSPKVSGKGVLRGQAADAAPHREAQVQVQVSLCISETLPLSEPAIAVYDVLFELVQGSIEAIRCAVSGR